jgi:Rrf2 family protein
LAVAIIGVLCGLLLPAMSRANRASQATVCLSNLRQVGTGLLMYVNDHGQRLPYVIEPIWRTDGTLNFDADPATEPQSLQNVLWPYLKGANVYQCPVPRLSYPSVDPRISGRIGRKFEEQRVTFMQLSQTAEYALRAVIWLGQNRGTPQTTQQIAEGCQMPASYLAKVLQPLFRAGIVSAQRGLGGGHVLERDVDDLTLLEVVNAVEPVQRIRSCPLKISDHGTNLCALHRALDETMATVEKALAGHRIGDLLRRTTGSRPLCQTSPAPVSLGLPVRPS